MAAAAAVSDNEDTNEDLDPAIKACSTLAEFAAASLKHPKALDGVDPAEYLGNRCDNQELASTALCKSL